MVGEGTLADHTIPVLRQAAADAGRAQPQVAAGFPVCVTDDVDAARARAAQVFAIYGQLPSYRAMLDREGLAGPEDIAIIGDESEVGDRIDAIGGLGVDTFLASNTEYAKSYTKGDLPAPPARKIAIVACMDARLELGAQLGLAEGDAHVIRNAGGAVTEDVIRSLTVSQRLLGTREIMLLHHTRCGMQSLDEEEVKEKSEILARGDEIQKFNEFHGSWIYEVSESTADKFRVKARDLVEKA